MSTTFEKGSGMQNSKNAIRSKSTIEIKAFLLMLISSLFIFGCAKDDTLSPGTTDDLKVSPQPLPMLYEVTNLVSDVAEYNPNIIDTNLVNAWGIAIGPTGSFWISAAETELSVIYDDEGNVLRAPVTMEGDPTGQVFNPTDAFNIEQVGGAARFIFATEYGSITAWRSGDTAQTMIDNSSTGASYTGIEIGISNSNVYLYVANVTSGAIEVYDKAWRPVGNMSFSDPSLPAGAKAFNIQSIGDMMYVTYVGPGGGYVNVFNPDGTFARRFAEGGTLNAPWGITNTPQSFGLGQSILIGNFGDGRINIFDMNGQYKGQLMNENNQPITIEGLWALEYKSSSFDFTSDPDLYFTAGPDNEEHGIFGEIELKE